MLSKPATEAISLMSAGEALLWRGANLQVTCHACSQWEACICKRQVPAMPQGAAKGDEAQISHWSLGRRASTAIPRVWTELLARAEPFCCQRALGIAAGQRKFVRIVKELRIKALRGKGTGQVLRGQDRGTTCCAWHKPAGGETTSGDIIQEDTAVTRLLCSSCTTDAPASRAEQICCCLEGTTSRHYDGAM